jgi:hypothetical protein
VFGKESHATGHKLSKERIAVMYFGNAMGYHKSNHLITAKSCPLL